MTEPQNPNSSSEQVSDQSSAKRRAIKIGSQRAASSDAQGPVADPAPSERPVEATPDVVDETTSAVPTHAASTPVADELAASESPSSDSPSADADTPIEATPQQTSQPVNDALTSSSDTASQPDAPSGATDRSRPTAEELFPAPPVKKISADLQAEIDAALGDISIDELMGGADQKGSSASQTIELDQRYPAKVIKSDRESVFVSFGGHHEGAVPRRQFEEAPEVGALIEVVPVRYLADDNLYEVVVPGSAVDVQDWSDLTEGVTVDAKITGHNKGGLECEVNRIPGFVPISQVSLYRIEDLEPYVGQTLQCVVTECNPARRNLVLSHRSVLEREKEQSREKLLSELEVGQIREGVVRSLQPFGAFVDLGGVDGLIHVSALSWDRVAHPSEVLETGQRVKVRIDKIDENAKRIGLSYRDVLENPWDSADSKFAVGSIVNGTVSKIMEFGAFVRLAAGVEGLVHISEIAHHRVHKVGAFLKPGQEVEVKILSLDPANQRMSLSIKAAQATAQSANAAAETEEEEDVEAPTPTVPARNEPLKGGLNRGSGGDQFGLKW